MVGLRTVKYPFPAREIREALVSEPQQNLYTVFQVEILGLSLILSCRAVINAAYMKAGVLMILNPPGLLGNTSSRK